MNFPFSFIAYFSFVTLRSLYDLGRLSNFLLWMAIRSRQAATFYIRATAFNFRIPFFEVAITVRVGQFTDLSIFTCSLRSNLYLFYSINGRNVRAYLRLSRNFNRNQIRHGRNYNAINLQACNARLGAISNGNGKEDAITINIISRRFQCLQGIRFRTIFTNRNGRFIVNKVLRVFRSITRLLSRRKKSSNQEDFIPTRAVNVNNARSKNFRRSIIAMGDRGYFRGGNSGT